MCILSSFNFQGVFYFYYFQYYTDDYKNLLNNKKINNNNILQNEEINKLKNELIKANQIIGQQNEKIKDLENQLKNNKNIIKYLKNEIKLKDKEINELKMKLEKINLNKNIFDKESIRCVNFKSIDENINYAIPCIKTDLFSEIEEKLYKKYPQYRNTKNYFISNGKEILRNKSISENNIGNGLPVMLFIQEK